MHNKPGTQVHFLPLLHWYSLLLLKRQRMQLDISTSKEVLMRNTMIDGQQVNYTFKWGLLVYVEINVMQMMCFLNILLTSIRILTYSFFYKMFQKNTSCSLFMKADLTMTAFEKKIKWGQIRIVIARSLNLYYIFCLFLNKSFLQEAEVFILFLVHAITFKTVIKNNIAFEFMSTGRKCYQVFSLEKLLKQILWNILFFFLW